MKENCIASITAALTNTARWRTGLDAKWPDHRNQKAAKLLSKLASETSGLTDAQFESLEPFVNSARWHEALREVSRMVGFHRKRVSFDYFARTLARALSATPHAV